jgi:O-antigen ligase
VPWIIPLGGLNLTVYRIVLLAMIVPCLIKWAAGQAGRIRVADIGLILFSLWAGVCLTVAHGFSQALQSAGILLVETVGAYMLARCYIRSTNDFQAMIRLAVKIIILIAPFTIYEWLTSSKPILSVAGLILPTVPVNLDAPRMGLWRAQGPFSHPIEFGLFCGSMLALTFLVLGRDRPAYSRWLMAGIVFCTTLTSMSSAPIAGLLLQIFLISWNHVLQRTRSRWVLLWSLIFVAYLVVEFGSNQTPIQFYISHFTFSAQTGWWRLLIWDYGTASVANHPLFGIGFGEWARPRWMFSDSIDNFWLANAIRYGLPALLFLSVSCLSLTLAIGVKRLSDTKLETCRLAYIACMATYFFVGSTVHFWAATYVWFLFLLGSGAWLLDAHDANASSRSQSSKYRRAGSRATERRSHSRTCERQ